MKINPTTRVSSSIEDGVQVITFHIPTEWIFVSDDELTEIYKLMAEYPGRKLAHYAFMKLTAAEVLSKGEGRTLFSFHTVRGQIIYSITTGKLMPILDTLSELLETMGSDPVRVENLHGTPANDRKLHGLPFSDWIRLDQAWQGFLKTHKIKALHKVAEILYPLLPGNAVLEEWERINVIRWMTQLKLMFSLTFPNFFKPASGSSEISMRESMDLQIRALTGGDIAKEKEILSADVWRALTELDFKAKEAEDFRRRSKKNR